MPKNKPRFSFHIETVSAIFIIAAVAAFIMSNFFIGFNLPIYLLAMSVAFFLSVFYPRAGLYASVFLTIIFERFFTLSAIYIGKVEYKFYPLDVIILAMFLGLLFEFLRVGKTERQKFKVSGNDQVLLGFILLNVVYFLFSVFVIKSSVYLAFSSLKNYGFYSLLYFLTFWLVRKREDARRLFHFFSAGALGVIGFIIFGIANGNGLWTEFTPLSTSGVRILAFTHGLYLSLSFVALIAFLITKKEQIGKNYLSLIALIWIVGIAGTMMRHLWIGVILAIFAIYFFIPREEKTILRKSLGRFSLIFAGAMLLLFYLTAITPHSKPADFSQDVVSALAERGSSIARASSDESFAWRELVWSAAYHDFKNDPLLGIGTGKMVYVETRSYRDFIEVRNIHNSYLAVMIQLGLLGFGMLIVFIYKNMRNLQGALAKNKDRFYALAILGVLVTYLVALFFQPYLETNLLAIFFWMSLGLSRNITLGRYE
ncbi:MAG: O-antigen ligase family protein [Parcubacteria group bacterium]